MCPSCNKLYKVTEILSYRENGQSNNRFKCTHVEFSNYSRYSQRQPCEIELTKQILVVNSYIRRLKMIFPLSSLKTQITTMYKCPEFKYLLRKWIDQDIKAELMSDIYDRKV